MGDLSINKSVITLKVNRTNDPVKGNVLQTR